MFIHALDLFANGLLIYVLFYAVVWLLIAKVGLIAKLALGTRESLPGFLEDGVLPFLISALAAFLAHAGLRWTMKRLRLRLSTSESSASSAFLTVLTVFSLSGVLFHLYEGLADNRLSELLIVVGAWTGVALRRRVAI